MEVRTDHRPHSLETIMDVHSSVSFIPPESSIARGPDRLEAEQDLEQLPIHDAGAPRTTPAERRLPISVGRRKRRLMAAGLLLAAAAIGAMSIRWPAEVQTVRRAAPEPQRAGAHDDAGPSRSDVVGATRLMAGQSLTDGDGLQCPEDPAFTRADEGEPCTPANRVSINNFTFHPTTLEVPAATRVVWVNADDVPHTVRSTEGLFRSGPLDTDDVYEREFSEPGTYEYYCGVHPHMTGKIVVK